MCVLDHTRSSTGQRNSAEILLQHITQSLIHPPQLLYKHLSSLFLPSWWYAFNNKCFPHTKLSVVQTNLRSAKDYFLNDSQGISFGQSKSEMPFTHSIRKSSFLLKILGNVCPTTVSICAVNGSMYLPLSAFHYSTGSHGHEWHTDGIGSVMALFFLQMLVFMLTKTTICTWRCRYLETIAVVLFPCRDFSAAF